MPLVVPAEGTDPVTLLDPQPRQRGGQLLGPGGDLGEGGRTVPTLFDRDDGAVAVDPLPVEQDVADQERGVLHGAVHAPSMTWQAPAGLMNGHARVAPHLLRFHGPGRCTHGHGGPGPVASAEDRFVVVPVQSFVGPVPVPPVSPLFPARG